MKTLTPALSRSTGRGRIGKEQRQRSSTVENVLKKMLADGLLSDVAAHRVRELVAEGKPFDEAVLAADGVSEEKLLRFMADVFEVPYVDLEKNPPSKEYLATFPVGLL